MAANLAAYISLSLVQVPPKSLLDMSCGLPGSTAAHLYCEACISEDARPECSQAETSIQELDWQNCPRISDYIKQVRKC